jgi:hypothetical protein
MVSLVISLVFLLLIPILPAIEEWRDGAEDREWRRRKAKRWEAEEERWQAFLKREEEEKASLKLAHEKGMVKVKAREARKARVRAELEARTEANRLKREMKGEDGEPDAPDVPGHHHYSRYYG